MSNLRFSVWCLAVTILTAGCTGRLSQSYPCVDLSGKVVVEGKPLASGKIIFTPTQSGQGRGVTAEIVDGRYFAKAVPLGKVLVMLNAVRETGRMVRSESSGVEQPERVELIPARHRAGIPLEVAANKTVYDFAL